MGVFAYFGVRKLASKDQGAFGSGSSGVQPVLEVTFFLGSASAASVQGLQPVALG